jgi:hypothetical protein
VGQQETLKAAADILQRDACLFINIGVFLHPRKIYEYHRLFLNRSLILVKNTHVGQKEKFPMPGTLFIFAKRNLN